MAEVQGNPFALLLGAVPVRSTMVVQGIKLPKGRKLRAEEKAQIFDGETPQEVAAQEAALARARRQATNRAKHVRHAATDRGRERRERYEAINKDKREADRKAWEARNYERRRAYKTQWAREAKLKDPAKAQADRERSAAYQRRYAEQRRAKRAAMTPEERAAHLEKMRAYRAANRDAINARKREWKARKAAEARAAAEGGGA